MKTKFDHKNKQKSVGIGVLLKPNHVNKMKNKKSKNKSSKIDDDIDMLSQMNGGSSESCLFELQMKNTSSETELDPIDYDFIEKWIKKFTMFLQTLPQDNLDAFFNSSEYPLSFKPQLAAGKSFDLKFKPATEVRLFGSYSQKTNLGHQSPVDVAVVLHNEFLKRDDYLNFKMMHKVSAYLMFLKRHLTLGGQLGSNVNIELFKSNALKPVLSIDAGKFKFMIHALPEMDYFKPARFLPHVNNVKDGAGEPSVHATPYYNYEMISRMTTLKNSELLDDIMRKNESIRVAAKLLKLWAKQRQFDIGPHGFNSFIISCYLVYLLKINKIQSNMSSYHIIRIFWNHFSTSKLDIEGGSLAESGVSGDFHSHFDLVMLDTTGYCNIFSLMPEGLYQHIKNFCSISLSLLEGSSTAAFQNLFLMRIPIVLQYDHLIVLKLDDKQIRSIIERQLSNDNKSSQKFEHVTLRKTISDRLKKGLGKRIKILTPFLSETGETCFGIVIDPEHAFEIIEKGPADNSEQAEEFRKFWGSKSEMRRFKDGTIAESVLWCPANSPLGEMRLIVKNIVIHLLQNHFNIIPAKINYIAGQFDITIRNSCSLVNETNEERSREIIQTFDELSKLLRFMKDLPLDIVSVTGTDSVFRYADPAPPSKASAVRSGKLNKSMNGFFRAQNSNNAIIQLSSSSSWPENPEAQRRLKTAFFVKIENQLKFTKGLFVKATASSLNILKNEQLFCFKVVHPKEFILEKIDIKAPQDQNNLMNLSKLTSALHGLYCRHPCFGPSAAIAKRWLFSQMVDQMLWPEILTELIIAGLVLEQFTSSDTQPQTTFFKFLHKIASFDPEHDMFFCNFNNDLSQEQMNEIERDFQKNRNKYPEVAVQTSFDGEQGIWSSKSPSIQIFKRVSMLAKISLMQIETNYLTMSPKTVDEVFTPSLTGYDAVIHLNSKYLQKFNLIVHNFSKPRKMPLEESSTVPAANLNLVESFISELRHAFGNRALFFINPIGGDKVAVILKPQTQQSQKDGQVTMNSMIRDIEIIGQGIVSTIEIFE